MQHHTDFYLYTWGLLNQILLDTTGLSPAACISSQTLPLSLLPFSAQPHLPALQQQGLPAPHFLCLNPLHCHHDHLVWIGFS